ncbi:MAG: 50S ribosomal protein L10 [Candidatus Omnitrophota bacterium]
MIKIGLLIREEIVSDIKNRISNAGGYLFFGLNKINAFSLNSIRNNLAELGSTVFVAKNLLIKRSFSKEDADKIESFFDNETAIVFINDADVIAVCKILADFAKENEVFMLKGGVVGSKVITAKDIVTFAKLPSREVLLAMAVGALAAPVTCFVNSLNQIILKFVWAIEEIKKQKRG